MGPDHPVFFLPMKHLILITLAGLMFIITIPREQALFGHVAAEKDRREHAEQQFTQQERSVMVDG